MTFVTVTVVTPELTDLPSLDEEVPCTWKSHVGEVPPARWRIYWKPWCEHSAKNPITLYCDDCMKAVFQHDAVICEVRSHVAMIERVLLRTEAL